MADAGGAAPPALRHRTSPGREPRFTGLLIGGAASAFCLALACTILFAPAPLLVWNASASSPLGLYALGSPAKIHSGDMVVAWAPRWARRMAAERRYLPLGVPLVKPVAAIEGARICARGALLFVDGRRAARRRARDPSGRTMPWWTGCRRLGPGELFLLASRSPGAFDGRYFGITRGRDVIGKARLVWAQ